MSEQEITRQFVRHWIGPSYGDWNDVRNWGETPFLSGGASVPTKDDLVFFHGTTTVVNAPPKLENWPKIVISGDWSVVEFYVLPIEHQNANALVASKVSVLYNNIFRLDAGTSETGQRIVHEFKGGRSPYVPVLSYLLVLAEIDRNPKRVSLILERTKAERVTVDWGDGTTDEKAISVGWNPRHPDSRLTHEYDQPGTYAITATAHADRYGFYFDEEDIPISSVSSTLIHLVSPPVDLPEVHVLLFPFQADENGISADMSQNLLTGQKFGTVRARKTTDGNIGFQGPIETFKSFLSGNIGFDRILLLPQAVSGMPPLELPALERTGIPQYVLIFAEETDGDFLNVFWSGGVNDGGTGATSIGSGPEFEVTGPILAGTEQNITIPKNWL